MKRDNPLYVKARALCKKIGYQFPQDLPEQKLALSVVEYAIMDLVRRRYRKDAINYLFQEEIPEAEMCGIDSSWIQLQVIQVGLLDIDEKKLFKTRDMSEFLEE